MVCGAPSTFCSSTALHDEDTQADWSRQAEPRPAEWMGGDTFFDLVVPNRLLIANKKGFQDPVRGDLLFSICLWDIPRAQT